MSPRYVATWRNTGDGASLVNAANSGNANATQQMVQGVQGVGDAFTNYDKMNLAKDELAVKQANEDARLALLQSADARNNEGLVLKKQKIEADKTSNDLLTQSLNGLQQTGSTEQNLKNIREASKLLPVDQRKEFISLGHAQLGVDATTDAEARNADVLNTISNVSSMMNVKEPSTLAEYSSLVNQAKSTNKHVKTSDIISENPQRFVNLAVNEILTPKNEQVITSSLKLVDESLNNLDKGLDDEELGKRKNVYKGLESNIRDMLFNGNELMSSLQLDQSTQKMIEDNVIGSNTPVGELISKQRLLGKQLAELETEKRLAVNKKADIRLEDYKKFRLSNTEATLKSQLRKSVKNKSEFSNEIDEISNMTNKLINNTTTLAKTHPEFVVAAVKELVSMTDSSVPFDPREVYNGWDEDAILRRATELYNYTADQGVFGDSNKASKEIKDMVKQAKNYKSSPRPETDTTVAP